MGGVEDIEIGCSFCGWRGTPAKAADHWCPGRRAFVGTYCR